MNLHFRTLGEGRPFVILHGLFGTSDNWQTLGRRFSETHKVYLADMRNHGRTEHSAAFDYQLMADDIKEFVESENLQDPIIMGHSMGGKAAMQFALQNPELLSELIVVDIAPKSYPPHHDEIIAGLKAIDLASLKSRNEADEQLKAYVPEADTRLFLLKNLYRKEDNTFAWRANLQAVEENIDKLTNNIQLASSFPKPTLFIRGGRSRYIKPEDTATIKEYFPAARIETIEEAGHWVHAEAPEKFYDIVMNFLKQVLDTSIR
ncbi:alpha/beta fold hydrolase [Adhaeribacter soli]|uniref:Alpha/beta fold hydrolase n=1 Tax=Adhaeribacter soli TaxID=2607655 RepID=A0A5N1IJM3_9BACT|nr:alpha/beta fold hydrolase [Adhaeribacter soli]KAA9325469.1 alpha/beta fold hydrolase [Adhaeribacter soli]